MRSIHLTAAAALFLLATAAQAQLLDEQWLGTPYSRTGSALVDLGDLDGDGASEFLVSEPGFTDGHGSSSWNTGRVRIYKGRTRALLREHRGTQDAESFGQSATSMSDLDGDAIPDYAIGAMYYDGRIFEAGRVVAYSGATGVELWSIEGSQYGGGFATTLAALDDMDGDQRMELLIGVTGSDDAWIVDSNGVRRSVLSGQKWSRLGAATARVGDLNLDGTRDFLIGAPAYTSGTKSKCGRLIACSGVDASQLYEVVGAAPNDEFGSAIAPMGDVNQDGWADYVVGAAGASPNAPSSGLAQILSGKDGTLLGEIQGTSESQRLGHALANLGDWDRDGADDFAVGAPGGAAGLGQMLVFSGATLRELWAVDGIIGPELRGPGWTGPGFNNGDFGFALTSGDFDGNGVLDLLVGDPCFYGACPVLESDGSVANPPSGPTWTLYALGSAYLYTGHPARWVNYGAGWPGRNGVPSVSAMVDPVMGEMLHVNLTSSLDAYTLALVMVGIAPTDDPTTAGGNLLVLPISTYPLSLPPHGTTLSAVLPDSLLDLYVQVLELDPFASNGISFTQGLHLQAGYDL